MRRALHLLILLAVLACGLHFGEPAEGHDGAALHQIALEADQSMSVDIGKYGQETPDQPADSGHHHCPIAPDMQPASQGCVTAPDAMLIASRLAPLHSRSQAPPIEPPLA